jgi:hypothetical protein
LPLNQARGFIQPRLRKYAKTAIVVELADAVLLREELIRLDQVDVKATQPMFQAP